MRALGADRGGAAAIEAALVMPMLLVSMAGLIDGSRALMQSMQVRNAAHAGAEWARENGYSVAGVQNAVTSATNLAVTASPAPTEFYGCATASNGVQPTSQSAKCSGDTPGKYVEITATAPFQTWAPWPGLDWPTSTTATAIVRID